VKTPLKLVLGKGDQFGEYRCKANLPGREGQKTTKQMHKTMKLLSLLALVACLALVGCDKTSTSTSTGTNTSGASTNK
jgi:hypothetical protein